MGSAIRREAHAGIERYAHYISVPDGIIWHPQRHQVVSSGDDAFGKEKAGHEVLIISRCAKSYAEGIPSGANLQRLFGCQVVFDTHGFTILPLNHLSEFDVTASLSH